MARCIVDDGEGDRCWLQCDQQREIAEQQLAACETDTDHAVGAAAGTTDIDPAADFDIVIQKPSKGDFNTMQVNGFGFGGQNASLVVTRD